MASTIFQDYNQNNPIVSSWLNDVNAATYSPGGVARVALGNAAAWVRFFWNGSAIVIQQSLNVSTVTRTSAGLYTITYGAPMVGATNCYGITLGSAGFSFVTGEAVGSVSIETTNASNVATDATSVSFVLFATN